MSKQIAVSPLTQLVMISSLFMFVVTLRDLFQTDSVLTLFKVVPWRADADWVQFVSYSDGTSIPGIALLRSLGPLLSLCSLYIPKVR